MHYYDILVADTGYRGNEHLTYLCEHELMAGQLVAVPLRSKQVLGIVVAKTSMPKRIKPKAILRVITQQALPAWYMPLISWIAAYYPASLGQVSSSMLPGSLRTYDPAKKKPQKPTLDTLPDAIQPPLTAAQQQAIKTMKATKHGSVLLHGVTGSGKTRLYIELAREVLTRGKSVFMLTPEIGLTPQLLISLREHFGNRVLVTHSKMTATARRDVWLQALHASEPVVVIGPRSALFTPIQQIGLIVFDEAHDTSYKQEQAPYHNATRVAATLAKLQQCKLVLGTATPSVVDYYTFKSKGLPIVRLDKQALQEHTKVKTDVIDTSDREHFSKSPWVSDQVLAATKRAVADGEQALVYLNRRGTARLVLCQSCSWQAICPRCDMNYVYHGDDHILRCHTCGSTEQPYTACPECGSNDIVLRSVGTKMILDDLQRLLPGARVARFDSDSGNEASLQEMYTQLHDGAIDIAIGTQVIGKGLDLPKLRVIAILQADSALALPDYIAEEELYQHIHQLIGRVGRGHRDGHALIQTRFTDHPVILAALSGSYDTFYQRELYQREQHFFPPFSHMLKISADRANSTSARKFLQTTKASILKSHPALVILGPAPAFKEKVRDSYRWHMIVKSRSRASLVKIARKLPANCRYDIDPSRIL